MLSPLNFTDSSLAEFINADYIYRAYFVFCYKRFKTKANVSSLIFDVSIVLNLYFYDFHIRGRKMLVILINEDAIFNILKILYNLLKFQLSFFFNYKIVVCLLFRFKISKWFHIFVVIFKVEKNENKPKYSKINVQKSLPILNKL